MVWTALTSALVCHDGRARTFFSDDDYRLYPDLLAEHTAATEVEVRSWSYGASAPN